MTATLAGTNNWTAKLLDIEGRPVTAYAMSCQKMMTDTCVEQRADYLLAVKGNQPTMKGEI